MKLNYKNIKFTIALLGFINGVIFKKIDLLMYILYMIKPCPRFVSESV